MSEKRPRFDSKSQTQTDPTHTTPILEMDDFNDYFAFHAKCEMIEHGDTIVPKKTSQKTCRFCT